MACMGIWWSSEGRGARQLQNGIGQGEVCPEDACGASAVGEERADRTPVYGRLTAADRQSIYEILLDTKRNLPEYWRAAQVGLK